VKNDDPKMTALTDALDAASNAYLDVAQAEMNSHTGSIHRVYDCVRNARYLSNKSRKVTLYGSVY
jgi:hypothetical protein